MPLLVQLIIYPAFQYLWRKNHADEIWDRLPETANKVYSCAEMCEERIYTGDYRFIDKEGEYIATLIMRAEAGSGMLRLFFRLVNGNKIITPVFWWQKYLGFYDIDNGTKLKLIYEKNTKGIYLKAVEILS